MSGEVTGGGQVADSVRGHWAERWLPPAARPYARLARLERPIGWWLLLLPGWWSIALATIHRGGGVPDPWLLALFLLGAVLMRGAGCTFNDLVDRDVDAKVARTRGRPLPSGQVTPRNAVLFMLGLVGAALLILLQFNGYAIVLGLASAAPIAIYPFMKRITWWPQLFLGIAFNWGALLGWAAVIGSLAWPPILLYAGGIAWTLAYDTIYAHQDKEDDLLIGVKSTALKFGAATPRWLTMFFAVALLVILLAGWLAGAGMLFTGGIVVAAFHAIWQLRQLAIDDPDRCLMLFRSNRDFGLIIFAGAVLDSVTRGGVIP
jgi:4-hydroxybenzoate polyprenyltransferase